MHSRWFITHLSPQGRSLSLVLAVHRSSFISCFSDGHVVAGARYSQTLERNARVASVSLTISPAAFSNTTHKLLTISRHLPKLSGYNHSARTILVRWSGALPATGHATPRHAAQPRRDTILAPGTRLAGSGRHMSRGAEALFCPSHRK